MMQNCLKYFVIFCVSAQRKFSVYQLSVVLSQISLAVPMLLQAIVSCKC